MLLIRWSDYANTTAASILYFGVALLYYGTGSCSSRNIVGRNIVVSTKVHVLESSCTCVCTCLSVM